MVTVGRLQRRKGHDLAIEALARGGVALARVRYLIVGDGEERERLQRLAGERGVRDRVTFTGAVSGDMLPDYYGAGDFFVHPNRIDGCDAEGFGIVFLEAAAAGLPTIGGASGGVPEAVDKDVTGLLVSGTDADELAAAIARLSSSGELRRQMGEAGRRRVLQQFTWERAAEQVGAIHHRLEANGRSH
jgi:phosphatidylinositol alpha-1,6-mannosyltransferase